MTSLKFLIGYNIGKLFKYEKNKETNEEICNFDKNIINPLTNKVIENFENLYKKEEKVENRFQYNTSIINECISTLVSLYLCGNESVQEIFYVNKIDNKSVTQTCWLLFFTQVISNLNSYNEKEKDWILEQGQVGWIIMNYILSEQKEPEELIKIELDETDKEKEKEEKEKEKEKKEETKSFKLIINKELFTDTVNDIITMTCENKDKFDESQILIEKSVIKDQEGNDIFIVISFTNLEVFGCDISYNSTITPVEEEGIDTVIPTESYVVSNNTRYNKKKNSGLSGGAIAGIVIACIVAVGAVTAVIILGKKGVFSRIPQNNLVTSEVSNENLKTKNQQPI
jgi:hypothetical protein